MCKVAVLQKRPTKQTKTPKPQTKNNKKPNNQIKPTKPHYLSFLSLRDKKEGNLNKYSQKYDEATDEVAITMK